jgi:uncharacterized membrane protein YagU involved in acid resistance
MKRWSPLAAIGGGIVAGLVGSLAQNAFFALTRRWAPSPPADVFHPPQAEQAKETATQTVARRVVEDLVVRGPVTNKELAGQLVHYAFGSAWGGVYGAVAGTLPRTGSLRGGLAFGFAVWLLSDDVLLPAFKLSAWPHEYPIKTHVYALAAHAVYGAALAGTLSGLQRLSTPAIVTAGSYWMTRKLPRPVRPFARRMAAKGIGVSLPVRRFALALS